MLSCCTLKNGDTHQIQCNHDVKPVPVLLELYYPIADDEYVLGLMRLSTHSMIKSAAAVSSQRSLMNKTPFTNYGFVILGSCLPLFPSLGGHKISFHHPLKHPTKLLYSQASKLFQLLPKRTQGHTRKRQIARQEDVRLD